MPPSSCLPCYEVTAPCCVKDMTFKAGLPPTTDIYVFVDTGVGTLFKYKTTTDADGAFIIKSEKFPAGYFIEGKPYKISVFSDVEGNEPLDMTLGEDDMDYSCIVLTLDSVQVFDPAANSGAGAWSDQETFIVE